MLYSRVELIESVLKYKNHFLQFVDQINEQKNGLGFPAVNYAVFHREISKDEDMKWYIKRLELPSMIDGGLFLDQDKSEGTLVMTSALYELLVFIDTSRNKQLSLAKFESMRAQMVQVKNSILVSAVGSDDRDEYMQLFWELVNEILTTFKENILVLNIKVDEVASMYKQLDIGEIAVNIDELYQVTQKLYERHMQPSLEFIDERTLIVGSENFVQAIDALYHFFIDEDDVMTAMAVLYKSKAISSYYKDIKVVSDRLVTYLHNLSEHRTLFMAVEHNYKKMMDALGEVREGKGRALYIREDADSIAHLKFLDGLSAYNQGYNAKFERHPNGFLSQFKSHYELTLNKPVRRKVSVNKKREVRDNTTKKRGEYIMYLMYELSRDKPISDIHAYINDHLTDSLSGYTLMDTLYGLDSFLPLLDKNYIKQQTHRARLEDTTHYLEYITLNYTKGSDL